MGDPRALGIQFLKVKETRKNSAQDSFSDISLLLVLNTEMLGDV